MLTFFRINDPYRILGILVLVLLIRLPFLWLGELTVPELHWMLLGEQMAEGKSLYGEVWSSTGPLAATVYCIIEWLFDRNQAVYVVLSALLVTYQALIFNEFLLSRKAFRESTYVPALVYVLLTSFSFDFYTLSPVLLALTGILSALRSAFYRVESMPYDARVLRTGLYLGVATLFYLPSVVFIIPIFITYFLFTTLTLRQVLLLLYGVAMPFLVALTYFYVTEHAEAFVQQYLLSYSMMKRMPYTEGLALLVIMLIPLGFLVFSIYKITKEKRFTIQQTKLQQVMFISIAVALLLLLMAERLAPYHLLFFVPPLAFFISYALLSIQRLLIAELVTALLFISLPLLGYSLLLDWFAINQVAHTERLLVQPTDYDAVVAGKRVLVLGDDINVYRYAKPATPYVDWSLASPQFEHLNYFENLSTVYAHLTEDMPEVIIDEAQLMPALSERIPVIREGYRKSAAENVYVKE